MDQPTSSPAPQSSISITLIVMIIVLVLFLIGLAWYRIGQKPEPVVVTQPPTVSLVPIEFSSDSDLQVATNELDATNLDQIDTMLDQNNTDANQF